jgi:iron complex outermembrane receptor protein
MLANILSAQDLCTGRLEGKVVSSDGQTLSGAVVRLDEKLAEQTDNNGYFVFNGICEGRHALSILLIGFVTRDTMILQPESVPLIITLRQEVTQLREVTVTDKSLETEHAHNTARMGEKELSSVAGKSLGESLKELNGVNSIQTGPGIFKPVIHGLHSQRVLILNNAIRQEGQQWGADHAPEIDPFIASEVVVVKDASSIKYGTDALGGVIIVNPPALPEKNIIGGTVQSVLQSNNRSGTLSGMIEGGINGVDGLGWRVQGTGKRGGDFHAADYNLTNTGVGELNFSGAVGYHNHKSGVELFYSSFNTEIGILRGASISSLEELIKAMEREPPQYTQKFSYDIDAPMQKVAHDLLKVNGHITTGHGTIRAQYGYQVNHRREFDVRKGALTDVPAMNLRLRTNSVETEWEQVWAGKRSLCIGLTGMLQDNENIPGTRRVPFIPNFMSLSGGLFGIAKIFKQNWVADFGARYDYRDFKVSGFDFKNESYRNAFNFHNVSASAGATIQLSHEGYLSTNISSAWRPPNVAELYSLGTHQSAAAIEFGLLLNDSTNAVMDFDEVKPNVEQAIKWVCTYQRNVKNVTLSITAYANYIFNYIYLRPTGVTKTLRGVFPALRYTQTDAFFTGVDFEAAWKLKRGLSIGPRASLLRASDVTNNDYLIYIPSNRFELRVRYDRQNKNGHGFFAELRPKFVAKQHRAPRALSVQELVDRNENHPSVDDPSIFDFAEALPAYWLVNAGVGYSLPLKNNRLDFYAAVDNMLNNSYREYTNRFRYYADDIGRNVSLSAKLIF